MATKKSKKIVADDVLNIEGIHIPTEIAQIAKAYYDAFLRVGFNTQQAFTLTQAFIQFYLWK